MTTSATLDRPAAASDWKMLDDGAHSQPALRVLRRPIKVTLDVDEDYDVVTLVPYEADEFDA